MLRVLLFSFLIFALQGCKLITQEELSNTNAASEKFGSPIHTKTVMGKEHGVGLFTPTASCSDSTCHGSDLTGNTVVPSCTSCHTDIWNTGGGTTSKSHSVNMQGSYHHTSLYQAAAVCGTCHGADLKGGTAASCYKCHVSRWTGEGGVTSNHTDSEDGYLHDPLKESPVGRCEPCHGATLTGGNASSCYKCHGAKWLESDGGDDD